MSEKEHHLLDTDDSRIVINDKKEIKIYAPKGKTKLDDMTIDFLVKLRKLLKN